MIKAQTATDAKSSDLTVIALGNIGFADNSQIQMAVASGGDGGSGYLKAKHISFAGASGINAPLYGGATGASSNISIIGSSSITMAGTPVTMGGELLLNAPLISIDAASNLQVDNQLLAVVLFIFQTVLFLLLPRLLPLTVKQQAVVFCMLTMGEL